MTPGARVAAAIEVLDQVLSGQPAEAALKAWGRGHRFAGSKDRAAIRDHVFQALRCRSSYAWLGGADTGRGIMLGAARSLGTEAAWFDGQGHAPAPATTDEAGRPLSEAPRSVALDMPEWILPMADKALRNPDPALAVMRERAGVFLRVNLSRASRAEAAQRLADDGIETASLDHVNTALQVTANERKVVQSQAYLSGLVELQDPASQIAVAAAPVVPGTRVLDYCAGGGGKALALADRGAKVTAHDVNPARMVDLPARAARAGVQIDTLPTGALAAQAPFDLVFVDAPCSGSGTWRRTPEAKWSLTPDRLAELTELQAQALHNGAAFVAQGGALVYATCSLFEVENSQVVEAFLAGAPQFSLVESQLLDPSPLQDGFYFAVMRRNTDNF